MDIGRPELVDAATLGVSELVTNALLHAGGGIAVRISDTDGRLRVEVYDESPTLPERATSVGIDAETNPSTVGRGLRILDAISLAWGVYDEETGKCVWFQPSAVGLPVRNSAGPLMGSAPNPASVRSGEHVSVQLLSMPVVLFAHYRTRLHDLRRELTLISLDDGASSEAGRQLIEAVRHHDHRVHHADMIGYIDEVMAVGLDRIDVELELPRSVLPEISLMRDVIRELNDFSVARRLLTLAPGPQERSIWEWYFRELLGQAEGAPPQPWTGDYHVTDPDPLSD
jgi:Histidine kinase-like ATPase domain